MLTVYGDVMSGNCLKVKWTLERLGIAYQWIETSVTAGETRTPAFLALHPGGQVPIVVLEDGRPLAQSNAILLHLAEGSDLIPADAYDRARMLEWLFWEQYSHEPYIAVVRYKRKFAGKSPDQIEPRLMERGHAALGRLDNALTDVSWLAGDRLSLADISLVAYTRWAAEGDFSLDPYPAVRAWIARVEAALGIG